MFRGSVFTCVYDSRYGATSSGGLPSLLAPDPRLSAADLSVRNFSRRPHCHCLGGEVHDRFAKTSIQTRYLTCGFPSRMLMDQIRKIGLGFGRTGEMDVSDYVGNL